MVARPLGLRKLFKIKGNVWANLYQNPASKFLELLARDVVYPYLVSRKLINLAELPTQGDIWLYSLVEREMGLTSGTWNRLDLLGQFPMRMTFPTWGQAMDFEDHLYALRHFTVVFSTKDFQETKSKTNQYFVQSFEGNVVSFKEAHPTAYDSIDDIARKSTFSAEPINVCWVEKPVIQNLREAWDEARARWQEKVNLTGHPRVGVLF